MRRVICIMSVAHLRVTLMELFSVAQVGLPAAGLVAYLLRHWWNPPGPEAGPPLIA